MEQYMTAITEAIEAAIKAAVPMSTPSKCSKPGFCPEAKEGVRKVNRACRRWQREQSLHTWEVYCRARNEKGKKLTKLMRTSHRERIEAASKDPQGLLKLAKWARNREAASQAFTPALKQAEGPELTEPQDKVELLQTIFLPTPAEADLDDIIEYEYPEPVPMPPITEMELIE